MENDNSDDHVQQLPTLEQSWIAAEAEADLAKELALRAERAAQEIERIASRETVREAAEIKLLIGQAANFVQRREEAEAHAIAAFDRFWTAKSRIGNDARD